MRTRRKAFSTAKVVAALLLIVIVMGVIYAGNHFFRLQGQREQEDKENAMVGSLVAAMEAGDVDGDEYKNMVSFFKGFKKEASFDYKRKYENLYVENDFNFKEPQEKTCYLTFDDGPDNYVTPQVLDTLKKYNVKATFFTIYNGSEQGTELYKRIVREGHTIAAHTYTHDYTKVYESVDSYLDDFDKISSHIEKTTGVKPEIFRFPGGSINYFNASLYRQISGEMIRRGYVYYDWNISAEDAVRAGVSAADITRYALSGDSSMQKKIVLMHDGPGHRNTAEALPGIIEGLAKQGYKFAPLTKEVMPVVFS